MTAFNDVAKEFYEKGIAGTLPAATDTATTAAITATTGSKAAGTAATSATLVGGIYNSTLPSPTAGQQVALQVDEKGQIRARLTGTSSTGSDGYSNSIATINGSNDPTGGTRLQGIATFVFNGATWDRQRGTTVGTAVVVKPETTGGTSGAKVFAATSTNATSVKASAGQIFGIELANNAAYAVFLKIYNKASAPTVGTDIPVRTIQIPAGGRCEISRPLGIAFSTGIAYAITKLVADSDTTTVIANDLIGSIDYI
jgi:hypothetical protein